MRRGVVRCYARYAAQKNFCRLKNEGFLLFLATQKLLCPLAENIDLFVLVTLFQVFSLFETPNTRSLACHKCSSIFSSNEVFRHFFSTSVKSYRREQAERVTSILSSHHFANVQLPTCLRFMHSQIFGCFAGLGTVFQTITCL